MDCSFHVPHGFVLSQVLDFVAFLYMHFLIAWKRILDNQVILCPLGSSLLEVNSSITYTHNF